jgi:hypothetical protein
MTQPAIVGKLRSELEEKIISERQVVYILVATRKLIDHQGQAANFKALKLYCNWVVHTQLDQSTAQQLIDELNIRHAGLHPGDQAQKSFMCFWDELSLDRFRPEFRSFLASQGLPHDICDDGRWDEFLPQYSAIIQGCPLTAAAAVKKQTPSNKKAKCSISREAIRQNGSDKNHCGQRGTTKQDSNLHDPVGSQSRPRPYCALGRRFNLRHVDRQNFGKK